MAIVSSETDSKQNHCMVHICLSKDYPVMLDELISMICQISAVLLN